MTSCFRITNQHGQAILEYTIVLGVITAAILAMQLYAKRGIQAGVKVMADQIGDQADGIRYESGERQNKVVAEGKTIERLTAAAQALERTVQTEEQDQGVRVTDLEEKTTFTGKVAEGGVAARSTVVVDAHE